MKSSVIDVNGGPLSRIMDSLGINQEEIVTEWFGDNLSNFIPLNIDAVQLICENINSILEKRQVDFIIEPEDLLNIERYEAKEKAELYINELDKHKDEENYIIDQDDIDDLELLLNKYDLMDKKIKAYEIIGDIYFHSRDYEKEYEYLSKAWELTTRYPKRKLNYRILIKLANNYIDREKYQEAITLYQKALLNIDDIPEKYLIHLYYNYALTYYRLKMYSISLDVISDLLKYTERKDYDLWRKAYILEGACYFRMEDYELALTSYNKALQVMTFLGHRDIKYAIYGNIAEAYTKLNDKNRAFKYIDAILEGIDELDKGSYNYLAITYQLAVTYENLGEFKQAKKYYKESLKYAKKNNQQKYILRNIISLLELNGKTKVEDISEIIDRYTDDIIVGLKDDANLLTIFKLLRMYADRKEYERLIKLVDKIIKYKGGESK